MADKLLLDTGALVSLLDRSQPLHEECAACFGAWAGPVSTEAVLTEATHLLGRVHRGRETCLDFVLRGGAVIVPSTREVARPVSPADRDVRRPADGRLPTLRW